MAMTRSFPYLALPLALSAIACGSLDGNPGSSPTLVTLKGQVVSAPGASPLDGDCCHRSRRVPLSARSPGPGSRGLTRLRGSGRELELPEPLAHENSGLRVVMRVHSYDVDGAT
jgi:hypothetical protein